MKRVFLVGCPRSGTTLLQVMLGSHSDIASFPESHFFRILLRNRSKWRRRLGLGNSLIADQVRKFTQEVPDAPSMVCPKVLPIVGRCSNSFIGMLDTITERRGRSLWVEKTPDHVLFIEQILKVVPDPQFIHIVRDGREVVASLYEVSQAHPEVWGGPWSVDKCIGHWISTVTQTMTFCPSGRSHIMLRYVELVHEPKEQLARICSFLEIPFEPEMTNRSERAPSSVISPGESWKSNVYKTTANRSLSKFHTVLDTNQRNYVSERVETLNAEIEALSQSLSY